MSLETFLNLSFGKTRAKVGLSHKILMRSRHIEINVATIDTLIVVILTEKALVSKFLWEVM